MKRIKAKNPACTKALAFGISKIAIFEDRFFAARENQNVHHRRILPVSCLFCKTRFVTAEADLICQKYTTGLLTSGQSPPTIFGGGIFMSMIKIRRG